MPTQPKQIMVFPEGADKKLLAKIQQTAMARRQKLFKEEHTAFLKEAELKAKMLKPITGQLGVTRQELEKSAAGQRRQMKDLLSAAKPGRLTPLQSHNPSRYAPFDLTYAEMNNGGITYCHLHGPNANTGEAGATLGIFNGGGASSVASVGFWYYAQQGGTLHLTIQSLVWGRGYVFSGLLGYASAYAGLRAYVERYSTDFAVYQATNNIYNNWGVLEFDIRYFDWVTRTVSINLPVRKGTWYCIWADMVQSAYAGGIADAVSNFDIYVGPVSYWVD